MKFLHRWPIKAYQRFISPHKGYRCAYSVVHGGPGCSGAVLEILDREGWIKGYPSVKARFAACKEAAESRKVHWGVSSEDRCKCSEADASCINCFDCVPSMRCSPGHHDCTPDCGDLGGCHHGPDCGDIGHC